MPAFFSMELQKKILARMDELNPGMSEEEILPVLEQYLWDGVNRFLQVCKLEFLNCDPAPESDKEGDWYYTSLGDYVRLGEYASDDFDMPVHIADPVDSEAYRLEGNPYLRSGAGRPRVYIGQFTVNNKTGLYLKSRGKPKRVMIQKRVESEARLNERALDPLSWFVAGDVFAIFGEMEKAKLCYEKV